jgi:CheY-like chemotaxis protein
MQKAPTTAKERERIDIIDIDIPFDREEVARITGDTYADMLGPSDMPVVEVKAREPLENYCEVGAMVCDIFKKMGATCKVGVKTASCPKTKAKRKKAATGSRSHNARNLIGIDQPFDYQEVISVTGPEYVRNLHHDGIAFLPYEELKKNISKLMGAEKRMIDVDIPFDYNEVVQVIGPEYVKYLSRDGMVMMPYESLKENIARLDTRGYQRKAIALDFPRESIHKNILVIDDEVAVNNNIRKILQKKGYQVDQAVTRDEAVWRINHGNHQVILLDLKIPGVTGLELLATIRNQRPDARVIMITGYASIETAVEAARMGVVEYLPKPFTPAEVRSATDKAFQLAA